MAKETFRRIGQKIAKPFTSARERMEAMDSRIANSQHELELTAQRNIIELYILNETILANEINELRLIGNKYPELPSYFKKHEAFETINKGRKETQGILVETENKFLSRIKDDTKKMEAHIKALEAARDFWKKEITQPDNTSEVIVFGRRRITQINSELLQLSEQHNSSSS